MSSSSASTSKKSSAAAASSEQSAGAHQGVVMRLPPPKPVPAAKKQEDADASAASPSSFAFDPLKLSNIRDTLMRLEESIIFALIERAQFKLNARIYDAKALPMPIAQGGSASASSSGSGSVLSYYLLESEKLGAQLRRFTSPSEHPFSDPAALPKPLLPELVYPVTVKPNHINHNDRVMDFYLATVLPSICEPGDDENYGSSAMADVACLQLLSKRVHYGKFVAESKFLAERVKFSAAIRARDTQKLMGYITKPVVEEQVLERVRNKAAAYGRPPSHPHADLPSASPSPQMRPMALAHEIAAMALGHGVLPLTSPSPSVSPESAASDASLSPSPSPSPSPPAVSPDSHAPPPDHQFKVPPAVIGQLYEIIMQLNKDVQIAYLMQRLEDEE